MRVSGITGNHVLRPLVVPLSILASPHQAPAVTPPAAKTPAGKMIRARVRKMIKERAKAKTRTVASPEGKGAHLLTGPSCHVFKRLKSQAAVPTVQTVSIATILPCSDPFVQWLHSHRVRVLLLFLRLTLRLESHLLEVGEVVEVLAV